MHHVVELRFDSQTEEMLRDAIMVFHQRGLCSKPLEGKPHVSLSSFATDKPIELIFSYVGVFPGEMNVLYLGVTPNQPIRELHAKVHALASTHSKDLHPLYFPEVVVLHSTLCAPIALADLPRAIELAMTMKLPTSAYASSIALVEYSPAQVLVEFPFAI